MAVGTGTIALSEVAAEIAGTQTSLQDCVDDHNPSGLNGTYYTAPLDRLSDFQAYNDTPATFYWFYGSPQEFVSGDACAYTSLTELYYSTTTGANGVVPITGDDVYFGTDLTSLLYTGYYKVVVGTGAKAIYVNPAGVVASSVICK